MSESPSGPEKPEPLGDVLQDLRDQGTLDSHGVLTIDPHKAAEKLRSFQVPRPAEYVLQAVGWAVTAGATRFCLTQKVSQRVIEHDGIAPDPDMLGLAATGQDLEGPQAAGRVGATLRWCLALGATEVRVECSDDRSGWGLVIDHDGVRELTGLPPGPKNRLTVNLPSSWTEWMPTLADVVGHGRNEENLLRQRCLRAPLAILVDGTRLQETPNPLSYYCLSARAYHDPDQPPLPIRPVLDTALFNQELTVPGLSGYLWVGSREAKQGWSTLHVIVAGVSYPFPTSTTVYGELRGPELRTDLSSECLIRDAAFDRLSQQVERQVEEMLVQLWLEGIARPNAPKRRLLATLAEVLPVLERTGRTLELDRLKARLKEEPGLPIPAEPAVEAGRSAFMQRLAYRPVVQRRDALLQLADEEEGGAVAAPIRLDTWLRVLELPRGTAELPDRLTWCERALRLAETVDFRAYPTLLERLRPHLTNEEDRARFQTKPAVCQSCRASEWLDLGTTPMASKTVMLQVAHRACLSCGRVEARVLDLLQARLDMA